MALDSESKFLGLDPDSANLMVILDKSCHQTTSSSSFPQIPWNEEVTFQSGYED